MSRCQAITADGGRCKNSAQEGSDFCHIQSHQEQAGIVDADWHEDLTDKQRRFVEEYCIDYNATRAAKRAGYSNKTARQQGSRLLSNVDISEAIEEYMDLCSMRSAEIIKRLTDMGRGSAYPFLETTEGGALRVNLGSEEASKNLHLIRKVKQTERYIANEDDPDEIERKTEFEIHDAKDALKQLAKIRGLEAAQKHEVTGKDGGPVEITEVVVEMPEDNEQ